MAKETRKWDFSFDNDNPEVFYKVDVITGEVIDQGTYKPVFNGDRLITAEQQAAWDKYNQKKEKKARRRKISKENGDHYFVPRLHRFPDLKPQTATRLIYLFTYADYSERGGHLLLTQKTKMAKKDLQIVLGLSDDAVNDFLAEVCPQYLLTDDKGGIFATSLAYQRGALRDGRTYHRFLTVGCKHCIEMCLPGSIDIWDIFSSCFHMSVWSIMCSVTIRWKKILRKLSL